MLIATPPVRPRTSLLRAGLRGVLLLLYAALVAELFIRVVHPQPRMPRYVTATAWGVRGNIPNATYRHSTAEVDVGFHINAQGMRADRDFPEAKPPGVCRIALLGDSFMMGYELDLPDTFAARLEKGLLAAGKKVEVLNFAVSGFGTAESLRTFASYGVRFDPNLVIMEWDRSDYDDNVRSDLYRLEGTTVVPTGHDFLPAVGLQERLMGNPVYRALVDHSDLFNFLREYLGLKARDLSARASTLAIAVRGWLHPDERSTAVVTSPKGGSAPPWAASISPSAVTLSAALLDKARHDIEAEGRGFLVLEIPFQYPAKHSVSSLSLIGPDGLSRLPVSSSVGAFNAEAGRHKLFYEYGDGHITPFAVGLMLQPVLDRLKADPHLSACSAS